MRNSEAQSAPGLSDLSHGSAPAPLIRSQPGSEPPRRLSGPPLQQCTPESLVNSSTVTSFHDSEI